MIQIAIISADGRARLRKLKALAPTIMQATMPSIMSSQTSWYASSEKTHAPAMAAIDDDGSGAHSAILLADTRVRQHHVVPADLQHIGLCGSRFRIRHSLRPPPSFTSAARAA